MNKTTSILALIIISPFTLAQDLGNPNCDSLLLVSSWGRDNVKIYDGCDGSFIRDLAEPGVLDGPQAMFQTADGDLVVVSESNHKLVQFDQATLSNATEVISPGLMNNPITVIQKPDGNIYLGSYSDNNIIEINTQTWQSTGTILPPNTGAVRGIDIGMAVGPDGQLYVPGYDSDNVLRVNPNGGRSQFVSSGANGLDRPRSILFHNNRMLLTAYGNQAIFAYDLNGNYINSPLTQFPGISGMIQDGPNHALVTSDTLNTVRRVNLTDFSFETVVPNRAGGLVGATYVYRMTKVRQSIEVTNMKQAWVNGLGTISENSILVNEFIATSGGRFGPNYDPDAVERFNWGQLLIEFDGCHSGVMSYHSNASLDGVDFGSGSYPIQRIALNAPGTRCDEVGFENTETKEWMQGTFDGGVQRSGEGFTIDYLNPDHVVVTWFTYLPAE